MKKFLSLFLIMALASSINLMYAQNVYACEDFSSTGEPIGEGAVWTIASTGGNIYLLYNHGNSRGAVPSQVAFYIDKEVKGSYVEYVTEIMETGGKKFVVLDQKFLEEGNYKIGVYTMEEKLLAETIITVNLKTSTPKNTPTTPTKNTSTTNLNNYTSGTGYYSNSKVIFCEDVVSNEPVNADATFNISRDGGYLQVQVNNGKAMKSTELVVKVYRKSSTSGDYDEFIETLTFPIEPEWDRPYFRYDFLKNGEYAFDIFTDKDVLIAMGYITINYQK